MKELFIETRGNISKYILLEDKKIQNLIVESKEFESLVGNIYVGRVTNIVNKNFAFINIGLDKNAFLDLNDNKESLLLSYAGDKRKILIKQGDAILVQVTKDSSGEKGVAVTSQFNLNSENLVMYVSEKNNIGVSKKIHEESKRTSLRELGEKLTDNEYSLVFRTNSKNLLERDIVEEYNSLVKKFNTIKEKGNYAKPPFLLMKEDNKVLKVVNEIIEKNTEIVVFNDNETYNKLKDILEKKDIKTRLLSLEENVEYTNTFNNTLEKLFHKKIWLKSGGHLIIEETEACVVIDVNSSKAVNSRNNNKTVLKVNIEALQVASQQIKLRNLSGIIIIDLIDMRYDSDKKKVLKMANTIFREDKIKTFVVSMTELGLLQLTRKKKRESISKTLKKKCVYCDGVGTSLSVEYVCDNVLRELFSLIVNTTCNTFEIRCNEKVMKYIKNNKKNFNDLEKNYEVKIDYKCITTAKIEYFEIDKNIKRC